MLMKIREVEFVRFPELARWIHCDLSAETFLPLMPTTLKRMRLHPRPLPIEAVAVEERVAAAYFTQLEGRVATLGGVRALSGFQDIGARLIEQLARDLRAEHGLQQIQAVVPAADLESREILGASGFTPLTTVLHLWRDARLGAIPPPKVVPRHGWTLANTLSANELADLIVATFVDTLDCPTLNGLRSGEDVLAGFLDGASLADSLDWELLEVNGQLAGCLLLKHHLENQVTELVYMGIIPELRGQGFGDLLLERTVVRAREKASSLIVVAVDQNNLPALKLYQRLGFVQHDTWSVWLWTIESFSIHSDGESGPSD